MRQILRRNCRPTTILLMGGFAVSLTAVLIGISSVDTVLSALAQTGSEAPFMPLCIIPGFRWRSLYICSRL